MKVKERKPADGPKRRDISRPDGWEFYLDSSNMWQWRKYVEKKVVAVSGDGFWSRTACMNDARRSGFGAAEHEIRK